MGIELWSRKQGLVRPPDTLLYAETNQHDFPKVLRKRVYIWTNESFRSLEHGTPMGEVVYETRDSWSFLYTGLCAAYGRGPLVSLEAMGPDSEPSDITAIPQLSAHVLSCPDNEVMDYVDAVFQVAADVLQIGADPSGDVRIQEMGSGINSIFEEEGIGYRRVAGQIVRFDEPVAHELAIKPAIELLRDGGFGAANDEFASALDAYRNGRWRDSITNANAAFESVLKILTGKPNLTAGKLISEARRQGLIPAYLGDAVEHLEKLLHASPATRGAVAAHGQGAEPSEADQHLAQFILTVVAASIVFLGRPAA